ncbi:hypothetical protein [Kitasatospora sp. DSM 101779]|uniref:hypothetical protein n=1 Tax=Kitasatospora sp. DSM 101779 TaxID=2853165 RepID=UPI0021D84B03|nr:hypothetical protein [Kitasatospora sp. DSM 101779]MCU7820095.1 hypothetical protein [Kitasatospora sp. DSM 101779]
MAPPDLVTANAAPARTIAPTAPSAIHSPVREGRAGAGRFPPTGGGPYATGGGPYAGGGGP